MIPGIVAGQTPPAPTPVQIILTSGTSWTVPSDWNSANNTIECVGGGAGAGAKAGGGAAYAAISNLTLIAGANIAFAIGSGGATFSSGTHGAGGNTWFDTTSTVLAVGAPAHASNTLGTGAAAASCVGTTKVSGRNAIAGLQGRSIGGAAGAYPDGGTYGAGGNGNVEAGPDPGEPGVTVITYTPA